MLFTTFINSFPSPLTSSIFIGGYLLFLCSCLNRMMVTEVHWCTSVYQCFYSLILYVNIDQYRIDVWFLLFYDFWSIFIKFFIGRLIFLIRYVFLQIIFVSIIIYIINFIMIVVMSVVFVIIPSVWFIMGSKSSLNVIIVISVVVVVSIVDYFVLTPYL